MLGVSGKVFAATLITPSILGLASCGTKWTGYGPLLDANADGLKLPAGFSSRIVATTGEAVGATGHTWHSAPDGGACFSTPDGGWVYVCNKEISTPAGGVGAVRFDSAGVIVDAYDILSGTDRNCAGGATPWGTWLSCEEVSRGMVWECDPLGVAAATSRPAMGLFTHEATAVQPSTGQVFLTEDRTDGCLYRFTPTVAEDLSDGLLEVMTEVGGVIGWEPIPDPSAAVTSTRLQVADAKHFNGGEGVSWYGYWLYFTTKGDNRVWRYRPDTNELVVLYDHSTSGSPVLYGVDNVTVSHKGDIFVAEDGGDMQVVLLTPGGSVTPFAEITGVTGSEVTGPAFSPDGSRFYFNSQRSPGVTYEVLGPFR